VVLCQGLFLFHQAQVGIAAEKTDGARRAIFAFISAAIL
jgi:hypothetical protein